MSHRTQVVGTSEVYRLASIAQADPRSIRRALRGEIVRGLAGERIARALAESPPPPAPRAGKRAP